MRLKISAFIILFVTALPFSTVSANDYSSTVTLFKNAGESAVFFDDSYGYAVFPSIGEGGFIVGGAFGEGRVYVAEKHVGDTEMAQLSVGFQFGGKTFSQIIFFKDERAFKEFSSGSFEFGADVSATAIKASAEATAGTAGGSAGTSTTKSGTKTAGKYHKGMATFTVSKGGLMLQAAIAGQSFEYTAK